MDDTLLKTEIGGRIRVLIKDNRDTFTTIAREYSIPMSTFNGWLSGQVYPPMQFLIKIAARYKVSLDWILTGQESLLPKDQRESDFIIRYRSLVNRGVAEPLEEFMQHQLAKVKANDKIWADRLWVTKAYSLDTVGKRLCYIRETEKGLTQKQMGDKIGLTERDYKKLEEDKIMPTQQVINALTGVLRDPETLDASIMDWLADGI